MFNDWSTMKKLIWLRGSGIGGGATPQYETVTGKIVSFLTQRIAPLKIEADLEPIQDLHGYDNPWPGGGGKNKCGPLEVGTFSESKAAGSTYDSMKASNNARLRSVSLIPINGQQVTVSWSDYTNYAVCFTYFDSDGLYLGATYGFQAWRWAATTINNASVYYMACVVKKADGSYMTDSDISAIHLQVEIGSSATTYSPYSNICPISGHTGADIFVKAEYDAQATPTAEISFGQTVYGGTLTVNEDGTGSVVATHGKVTFDANNMPTKITAAAMSASLGGKTRILLDFSPMSRGGGASGVDALWCDRYKTISAATMYTGVAGCSLRDNASTGFYIYDPDIQGKDAWTTEIQTNGITFCYPLAEPVTITLTPGQVNALQGNNTVWVDESGEIKVTYQSN